MKRIVHNRMSKDKIRNIVIFGLVVIVWYCVVPFVVFAEARNPFKDWLPEPIKNADQGLENIFHDLIEEEVEIPPFNVSLYAVQGIFWGSIEPKAIINNTIYHIGDELDGAIIKKIDKEGVTVEYYEEEYVITIREQWGLR